MFELMDRLERLLSYRVALDHAIDGCVGVHMSYTKAILTKLQDEVNGEYAEVENELAERLAII